MNSVYEQMASNGNRLLDKMVTNPDLCNFILGLLARCIVMCQERGLPLEGISMGPLSADLDMEGNCTFRSKVTFEQLAKTPAAIWPLQSDFAKYTRAKAHGLGLALQKNPKFAEFFQDLVERLDNYAISKGIKFGALKMQRAIISNPGDTLVLKVGKYVITDPRKLN